MLLSKASSKADWLMPASVDVSCILNMIERHTYPQYH
jgi:hypothetical protein